MASERQIEANRRNARKSTGPRSTSGKKRASGNAFRHGLTKPISSADFEREVERLAAKSRAPPKTESHSSWPATPQRQSLNWHACAA